MNGIDPHLYVKALRRIHAAEAATRVAMQRARQAETERDELADAVHAARAIALKSAERALWPAAILQALGFPSPAAVAKS